MDMTLVAALLGAALIFSLRLIGVSLGTVRILMMTRGVESWAAVLGFFEVLVYVVAIGAVVRDLGNVVNIIAYSAGFSAGTLVGIRLERRLAFGHVTLRTFSAARSRLVASALREAGFGATLNWGEGLTGPVGVVSTVVPRKHAVAAQEIVRSVDAEAFVIADDTRSVARGWMRVGLGQT
jgi:uncharacterized protein YebE (UPF0316 family)